MPNTRQTSTSPELDLLRVQYETAQREIGHWTRRAEDLQAQLIAESARVRAVARTFTPPKTQES